MIRLGNIQGLKTLIKTLTFVDANTTKAEVSTIALREHCSGELKSYLFVCVEVLRPSQPNGAMSSVVSLPNHTFTWQA